jgi:hypothetical protein
LQKITENLHRIEKVLKPELEKEKQSILSSGLIVRQLITLG